MRRAKKKKGSKRQRAKPLTSTHAIDALIRNEEQVEKQKKEEKEKNRERDTNPVTVDHFVTDYKPHGSYGDPVLKSTPTGRK